MSEFGLRLRAARKHAKLTQVQLAKAVGMSQGSLSEAELSAAGSSFTPQLATACGVNAHWLATGEGQMLGSSASNIHYSTTPEERPPLVHSLQALDEHVNALTPILQAAARDILQRWALGQVTKAQASNALQAIAIASESLKV